MYQATDRLAEEIGRRLGLRPIQRKGRKEGKTSYYMDTVTGISVLMLHIDEHQGEVIKAEFVKSWEPWDIDDAIWEATETIRLQTAGEATEPAEV